MGAHRTPSQARAELRDIEAFCKNEGQWGPAGLAHVAGIKLAEGASREDLLCILGSAIATLRIFRPTTSFDFVSGLGFAHGAYCLIARIAFGVLRARAAEASK